MRLGAPKRLVGLSPRCLAHVQYFSPSEWVPSPPRSRQTGSAPRLPSSMNQPVPRCASSTRPAHPLSGRNTQSDSTGAWMRRSLDDRVSAIQRRGLPLWLAVPAPTTIGAVSDWRSSLRLLLRRRPTLTILEVVVDPQSPEVAALPCKSRRQRRAPGDKTYSWRSVGPPWLIGRSESKCIQPTWRHTSICWRFRVPRQPGCRLAGSGGSVGEDCDSRERQRARA